jgi:astacin
MIRSAKLVVFLLCLSASLPAAGPWHRGNYRGRSVLFRDVQGYAVYQGDIIIGRTEEVVDNAPGLSRKSVGKSGGRSAYAYPSLWTNATVPYVIDPAIQNPKNILDAIQHWRDHTVVKFTARTSETNYVLFKLSNDNSVCSSSAIGMLGGQQVILGSELCPTGALIHEIGHAVGLEHEQARWDRDYYVKILFENMIKVGASQYSAFSSDSEPVGDYDFGSIMHYGIDDFSKGRLATMETIPAGIPVGQINALSAGDIDSVNAIYGSPAKQVTIATNPPGLQVLVDGQVVQTPAAFDWASGSDHTLEAISGQTDAVGRYDFGRWSNDGDQKQTITARPEYTTLYTANMVRYVKIDVGVVPPQAGTVVVSPASEDKYYRDGEAIEIQVKPADGYYFANWRSDYLTQNQYTVLGSNPMRGIVDDRRVGLTAVMTQSPPTTITSDQRVTAILIDGKRYFPPANFLWEPGTTHTIEVDSAYPDDGGVTQRVFVEWSDGGERAHTITAGTEPVTYRAKFRTRYLLAYGAFPKGTGTLTASPVSSDGFYDEGTVVQLNGTPESAYRFGAYFFDLTGSTNNQSLTISEWNQVLAYFVRPNTVPDYGVVNAATRQPADAVTGYTLGLVPGEIITIYTPGFGPDTPAQATPSDGTYPTILSNTRVLFDGIAAPVLAASKNEITTVVPYRLSYANGSYVQAEYNGQRTARVGIPTDFYSLGVFTNDGTGRGQGRILNEDGTENSPSNPAVKGSLVTLYATGQGDVDLVPVDGAVATKPLSAPLGSVEVRIGSRTAELVSVGAAEGEIQGLMKVQARIPDTVASGPNVPVVLTIDGQSSQFTVTMAVQ